MKCKISQGIVIISCVSMFIFVPLGGIIEVCVTNKGTFVTGIKNSIYGACRFFYLMLITYNGSGYTNVKSCYKYG